MNTSTCPKCGATNAIVNQCGCDPHNLPTKLPPTPQSLYQAITAAGIRHDHHAADLVFPNSERTREILLQFPAECHLAVCFSDQRTGEPWFSIPFAYDPYWDALDQNAKDLRAKLNQPQPKAL